MRIAVYSRHLPSPPTIQIWSGQPYVLLRYILKFFPYESYIYFLNPFRRWLQLAFSWSFRDRLGFFLPEITITVSSLSLIAISIASRQRIVLFNVLSVMLSIEETTMKFSSINNPDGDNSQRELPMTARNRGLNSNVNYLRLWYGYWFEVLRK